MKHGWKTISAAVAAVTLSLGGLSAEAADWPTKKVQIYAPASPGGGTDSVTRTFARFLEKHTGVNAIVVNQTGGGGVVAVQTVKEAEGDGGTLLMFHAMLHAANLFGRSPFTYKDLTPLAVISENNDVYVAQPDAPYDTLPELFDYAKQNPGKVVIASQLGGTTQVKGQALLKRSGAEMKIVDAGSESKRVAAFLGKQVDIAIVSTKNALQYQQSGDMKILGVLNEQPDPFVPDWPTAKSQGVDIHFPLAFTLYAPRGTSSETLAKLDSAVARIAEDPEFQEALKKIKQVPAYRDAATTAEYLEGEYEFVSDMIK